MLRAAPALAAVLLSIAAPAVRVEGTDRTATTEGARADDLARSLGALTAPSSAERLAARRWLAAHVEERDFAALADAVRVGDAELRRGLREVLAGDDRHLGLAARFASERDGPLAGLGNEAIGEMLARLGGGLDRRARSAEEWVAAMRDLPPLRVALDPGRGTLAEELDRVARLVPGAPPIVLDPELDQHVRTWEIDRAPSSERLSGRFEEVLVQLCELQRVELEVFGGEGGAGLWIHVMKDGAPPSSARELLARWCAGVVRQRDPSSVGASARASARADARALATSGWPAALAWLERRAADGDAAARSGVVLAAGRGLVVPSLARPSRVRGLAAELARGLAAGTDDGRRWAEEVARALARIPPVGPDGEDLALSVVDGAGELGHEERTLRLVALEGMRSGAAAVERAVLAALADPSASPAASGQRLQALRALAAAPGRRGAGLAADALGAPQATWAWAGARGLRGELVDLACELRLPPPALELAPDAPLDERIDLLAWWTFRGVAGVAAAAVVEAEGEVERRIEELLAAPRGGETRLAPALGDLARRGAGPWLAARLDALRAAAPGERAALERLALACGGVPPERRAALLESALAAPPDDGNAYRTLGALAADQELGDRARAALLERFDDVDEDLRLSVLTRATRELARARLDAERAAFEEALRDPAPGTWFLGRWARALAELEAAPEPLPIDRLERGLFR